MTVHTAKQDQVMVKAEETPTSNLAKSYPFEMDITDEDDDEDCDKCMACDESVHTSELVELRCGDCWCESCLQAMFDLALKDETAYPPRCCGIISLKEVRNCLPKSVLRKFEAKRLELETKNKTYCHITTCSTFIAPHSIHNGQAICQKCDARTCTQCRAKWHFGPCSGGEDQDFVAFANSMRFKRCPECKRFVEKTDGCNMME